MRPADLVRLTGLDKSAISRILSGDRSPDPQTIKLLGQALRIPPETIFRISVGLPPQGQDTNADDEQANHLISTLKKPSSKQRAIDYLQLLIEQEEREERENAAKKNHPATQPR